MASATSPVTGPTTDDLPPGNWPAQRAWTVADWARLPSAANERYEVIDGALFMTAAPSVGHQWVAAHLTHFLIQYIRDQDEPPGVLFPAPTGVIPPTGAVIPDWCTFA